MSLRVTKVADDHFEIELSEPDLTWLKMLEDKMVSNDVIIVGAAVNFGMMEMFAKYVHPERMPERDR